jgi:hypothetical protein
LAAFVKEKSLGGLLDNVSTEFEYRYDICLAAHGALVEHKSNVGHKNLTI